MAQMSVAQFAGELKVPPSQLLEQLRAAGVHKQVAEDVLSEQDKTRLLEYLRKSHGSSEPKNKITLTRKQTSARRSSAGTRSWRHGRPRTSPRSRSGRRSSPKASRPRRRPRQRPLPATPRCTSRRSRRELRRRA